MGVGGGRDGRRGPEAAPRLTIRGGRPEALPGFPRLAGHPVEALREALASIACDRSDALPPFCGGFVGYLGWAAAAWSERLPQRLGPDPLFPEADLLYASELVAFDHRQGRAWAIASGAGAGADSPESRAQALADRVLAVFGDRRAGVRWPEALRRPAAQSLGTRLVGGAPRGTPVQGDGVRNGRARGVPLKRLPEPRPVRGGGEMTLRPIAGTRPRGATAAEDERLERELRADPKELAEHTMLVDLGRNDVGRVSRIGSVRVARLMETERFSHVMHLTSEVTGQLRPGLGAVEAFAAAFPAGTLSGAPKIRALQIIDELETVQRGPYGGAVGWFSAAGDVQLAIAIRTLFRAGGRLFAQAGAGIVADSKPENEWREVLAKVRASVGAAYGAVAGRTVEPHALAAGAAR